MKVVLKKEIYGSREQCMRLTEKPPQPQKFRNALQKKNVDTNVEKAVSKQVLSVTFIDIQVYIYTLGCSYFIGCPQRQIDVK